MDSVLTDRLAEKGWLLADGATGTNYFAMGLRSGEPPENWNFDHPERVRDLHRRSIEAGSEIVLTNSFGGNRRRLMLHGASGYALEINKRAAGHARDEAAASGKRVLVAGSMGPTGDLLQPLGELTRDEALEAFAEQARGLAEGGADLLWIETLSSEEEASAAVEGAGLTGLPVIVTLSFDSGGRTMMGIKPEDWPVVAERMPTPLAGLGANCGVGAAELVATVLGIAKTAPEGTVIVAKGNCGVPEMIDGEICYSGTPALMADYARMVLNAGARIIGGCCGTTAEHLKAMRAALEGHVKGSPPDIEEIMAKLGDVSRLARGIDAAAEAKKRRRPK
ncbi:MAG: betaine--homocysteine S-methyltransferase [Pseudomonadota bacterium]